MIQPVGRFDQRRTAACSCDGEIDVVGCSAELDVLLQRADVGCAAHVTDESEPTARHSPNQTLISAVVANGPPRSTHPAGERIVRHAPSVPHRADELFFADDAVAMGHEVDQHIEHLRLDVNDRAVSTQLAPAAMHFAVAECEGHQPGSQKSGLLRQIPGVPSGLL